MKNGLFQLTICIFMILTGSRARCADPAPEPVLADSQRPVISSVTVRQGAELMATAGDDHIVRIWNLVNGKQIHQLQGHTGWIRTSVFIPRSNILITAGDDGQIIRWDVVSGKQLDVLTDLQYAIWRIAVNPGGTRLAVSGFSKTITVVDLKTQRTVRELQGGTTDIRGLAFSGAGDQLVSGGRDGLIRIWSTETGQMTASFIAHQRRIRDLCFFREDSQIISIADDRTLHVCCLNDRQQSYSIPLGRFLPLAIAACNEDQIAVGSSDNQIHLWNLAARQPTRVCQGHTGSVVALDFTPSPDGRGGLLISGSYDTSIRTWRIKAPENSTLRVSKQNSTNRK